MADITQVINEGGHFQKELVQKFVINNAIVQCKNAYRVVAVLGRPSSSALLDDVFGTRLTNLAGTVGTTKGIWLAKSPTVIEATVLMMGVESSNSFERSENDSNFERQLVTLASFVADVLLVNISSEDIGREQGAEHPLLVTILQVSLQLAASEPKRRRPVLLLVVSGRTKAPPAQLLHKLQTDLRLLWADLDKPAGHGGAQLGDVCQVQYVAMPDAGVEREEFVAAAEALRRRFQPEAEDSLIPRSEQEPPAGDLFMQRLCTAWEVIRAQKDLNLPAHKVMVASVRCAEILEDQLRAFEADQAWGALREAAGSGLVEGFGARASSLADSCVKGYESEALYFDAEVRSAKRVELLSRLQALLQPPYQQQLAAQQAAVLAAFKNILRLELARATQSGSSSSGNSGNSGSSGSGTRSSGSGTSSSGTSSSGNSGSGNSGSSSSGGGAVAGGEGEGGSAAVEAAAAAAAACDGGGGGGGGGGFLAAAAACREKALQAFAAAYKKHLRIEAFPSWDGSSSLAALARALDSHLARLEDDFLDRAEATAEQQLQRDLAAPLAGLLQGAAPGLWPRLHAVCREAAAAADRSLMQVLVGFGVSLDEAAEWSEELRDRARRCMEEHVRATVNADFCLQRMKDRFQEVFSLDEGRAPRMWGPRDDIPAIAQEARTAASSVLSQLAVMRPPPEGGRAAEQGDLVEAAVLQLARNAPAAAAASSSGNASCNSCGSGNSSSDSSTAADAAAPDVASITVWPGVDEEAHVLLPPEEVRAIWREFLSYSALLVGRARAAQGEALLRAGGSGSGSGRRWLPWWALGAMAVLLVVLWRKHPAYLALGLVSSSFLYSVYKELGLHKVSPCALPYELLRCLPRVGKACQSVLLERARALQRLIP